MIRVFETVQAAYSFVWRERLNFVLLASLGIAATATISAIGQSVSRVGVPLLLPAMALLVMLLQLSFAIVWHRRYLVPDGPTAFLSAYSASLRQYRFIVLALIAYGFLTFIVIALSPAIYFVADIFFDSKSAVFHLVVKLLRLLLLAPLGLLFARLSLLFPAAAVGQRLSVAACWRMTKGQAWPLFFILVLVVLPVSLASWLLGNITEGLIKLVGVSDAMIEGYIVALVDQTFGFVAIATATTALSIAYAYTTMAQMEGVKHERPAEPERFVGGHGYPAVTRLIAAAIVVGIVFGGLLFIAGFFGPLLFDPGNNLGPLAGFILAPIGFIVGISLGLLWNARKATKVDRWPRLAYFAFLGSFLVGGTAVLNKFSVFHSMRTEIAETLPSPLKRLAAPGGVLKIWLIGVPVEKRQRILEKTLPIYVGGPLSGLGGAWDVRFVDAEDFITLHRQERARGQGPDVVVGEDDALFTEFLADPAIAHRLPELRHFAFSALGPYAYADRDSKNFELARDLALSNDYCWRHGEESASQSLKTELGQLPTDLAVAFLTDDLKKLEDFTDLQNLPLKEMEKWGHDRPRIDFAQFCHVWGTPKLAFAEVFVNYESTQSIGRTPVFITMCKMPSGWRLLEASDNCESISDTKRIIPRSVCK